MQQGARNLCRMGLNKELCCCDPQCGAKGYLALAFLFVCFGEGGCASLFGFSFNKGSLFFLVPKKPVSPLL